MSFDEALEYETRSFWLSQWAWFGWANEAVARYCVWKTRRKFARYAATKK